MIDLAVLDVAGTTVDVTDAVGEALVDAFYEHGLVISEREVQAVRGISKRRAIHTLFESRTRAEAAPGRVESLLATFRSNLRESCRTRRITALPGSADAIRRLKERGVCIWLSTGFDREMAELVVERSDLASLIDGLATDDDVLRGRPAPDLIQFAMKSSRVTNPSDVVVAGDTSADLEAAVAAGVGCAVGVLTGAHGRRLLSEVPHDLLLDDIAGLPAELDRLGLLPGGSA